MKTKTQKHTPGPWRYQCRNSGNIGSKDAVTVEADSGHIALIKRIMQENGRNTFGSVVKVRRNLQEVKANACLIAAAPDQNTILKALLEFWDNGTPIHPGAEIVDEVRAVVRKAKGAS